MVEITPSKILALLIGIAYVAGMVVEAHGMTAEVCKGCAALLLPLALIWFPDEIGNATGYIVGNYMRVDKPTPPILISIMGCLFLVGLPVLLYFIT